MLVSFILFGLVAAGLAQTTCRTPNNEHALCVPVYRCPVLKKAYSNPSQEVQRFLRESECAKDNSPWVCCGRVARYQSLESITATSPPMRTTTEANRVQALTKDPKQHKKVGLLPTVKQCGKQNAAENIVGGNKTLLDEFPWMALLEYEEKGKSIGFQCGGMLINNRYVLTAAHCVGKLFRVRLGEHNTKTPEDCETKTEGSEEYKECVQHQDILVEESIAHPEYNSTGERHNDIGLVRLVHPVVFKYNIRPICLPMNGEASKPGTELHVAGWGSTGPSKIPSEVKLKIKVPIVSLEECAKLYKLYKFRLTDKQLCAGGVKGIDSCPGDSGGPIMGPTNVKPRRWYAEGIVSYGPNPCGTENFPAIYTKVSSYMNWILDNMKP